MSRLRFSCSIAFLSMCTSVLPATAQTIQELIPYKAQASGGADDDFRLVPPSPEELAMRELNNPKKDGALAIANIDLTTPISADPQSPNYYYYHGQATPLPLDTTRIAVRVGRGIDLTDPANRTQQKLGVDVSDVQPMGVDGWNMLVLAQPLVDEADAHARIELTLAAGTVEYAAPVFRSLLLADGWVTIWPDVLVRFNVEQGEAAETALRELTPDFPIKEREFGGLRHAYRLSSVARNGFDVLTAANRLSLDTRVDWAEPELFFSGRNDIIPDDPEMSNLWGIRNTGATYNGTAGTNNIDMDGVEAWNITTGVSSVRVLVIDNGVQQNHPDLNQNAGRDFTGGEADGVAGGGPVNACDNHGTAVAGCVSASFNNTLGVVGLAPSCRVVSARCMVAVTPVCSTSWNASNTWTVNALNWAVNNSIQITNNSNAYGAQSNAIDAAYLNGYNSGQVHFASAGNNGTSTIAYPSSADTVNAVANLTQAGALNGSSQFGTGLDFSAPGTDIRTTDRTGSAGYGNTDYSWINGTSFASPYAASVAALVKTAHPTWSSSTIETAMKSGATDLAPAGYDTTFGWGLVNAHRSITVFGPSNDECINPLVITGTSYTGNVNTVSATTSTFFEPDESCEFNNNGVSNSVWFRYEAPAAGTITVNTFGSNYDTVLSMWDGCNSYVGANLIFFHNQLACSDDINGGLQSQVSNVSVTPGGTYLIKVSDYNTAQGGGNLTLNLSFTYGPPANDFCVNRTPLPNTPGVYNFSPAYTATATANPGECFEMDGTNGVTACGHPSGNSNSVFYSFIPSATGTVTIDTFGSDYDTVLALFNGTAFVNPCGDGGVGFCMGPDDFGYYVCDDDAWPGNLQSRIWEYPVTAGHVFVLKVSDYNPTPGGGWLYLNMNYSAPRGDINGDGGVTVQDIAPMIGLLINPGNCPGCNAAQGDMNYDGVVDGRDIQRFANLLVGG